MASIPSACAHRAWLEVAKNISSCSDKDLLTVMSYNILCQTLIKRSRYPYASKGSLKWKTRKEALFKELKHWDADIVCLQEMGINYWNEDFDRFFVANGYRSRFFFNTFKSHGVSVSWKRSKFHIVDELHVSMDGSAEVCGESLNTQNIALVVVLRKGSETRCLDAEDDESGARNCAEALGKAPGVIISNTHLYWLPGGCYERLQQQIVLLRGVKEMQEKYPDFAVISCGDFNTTPDDAGYDLLTKPRPVKLNEWQLDNLLPRTIEDDDDDEEDDPGSKAGKATAASTAVGSNNKGAGSKSYASVTASPFDEECARAKRAKLEEQERKLEEQAKVDAERVQRLVSTIQRDYKPLQSCYGAYTNIDDSYRTEQWHGEPKFTNYTDWKGTLDYIFFAPGPEISLRDIVSLPDEKRLKPGLPNDAFPSDHVSLLARFGI